MVEQAYALAWKQAFHLEKSWKVHARAARERGRGSEGRAKKESSPFSPIPPKLPNPPPPGPARSLVLGSLRSSKWRDRSQAVYGVVECLKRRRLEAERDSTRQIRRMTSHPNSLRKTGNQPGVLRSTSVMFHSEFQERVMHLLSCLFVCLFDFEVPVARRHRLSLGSCNDYKGSWWGEIIQM